MLHVFELVSEQRRTVGWCTQCRRVWPLAELTDGQRDEPGAQGAHKPKSKADRKKAKTKAKAKAARR